MNNSIAYLIYKDLLNKSFEVKKFDFYVKIITLILPTLIISVILFFVLGFGIPTYIPKDEFRENILYYLFCLFAITGTPFTSLLIYKQLGMAKIFYEKNKNPNKLIADYLHEKIKNFDNQLHHDSVIYQEELLRFFNISNKLGLTNTETHNALLEEKRKVIEEFLDHYYTKIIKVKHLTNYLSGVDDYQSSLDEGLFAFNSLQTVLDVSSDKKNLLFCLNSIEV